MEMEARECKLRVFAVTLESTACASVFCTRCNGIRYSLYLQRYAYSLLVSVYMNIIQYIDD